MSPEARRRSINRTLALATLAALVAATLFMTLGVRGGWDFVLPFRGAKLAGLAIVAVAIAVSTVIFQTITQNRILTPSIMGFDSLYVLIQTVMVFFIGAAQTTALDPRFVFTLELALMMGFAMLLFRWMFGASARGLHLMLLVGIVLGTLFRSLSSFLQRLIDPSEFLILQDRLFASFNGVDQTLLGVSALALLAVCVVVWRMIPTLDVLALGRDQAVALGVNQERAVWTCLALVTLLVSVATALVGPVTFFGLLVANLAYLLLPTARHAVLLPAAALIACILLVGGQVILERVFGFDTVLAVIIEFVGGVVFLLLVIRKARR